MAIIGRWRAAGPPAKRFPGPTKIPPARGRKSIQQPIGLLAVLGQFLALALGGAVALLLLLFFVEIPVAVVDDGPVGADLLGVARQPLGRGQAQTQRTPPHLPIAQLKGADGGIAPAQSDEEIRSLGRYIEALQQGRTGRRQAVVAVAAVMPPKETQQRQQRQQGR